MCLCFVFVLLFVLVPLFVSVSVFEPLAERLIRLVLDEITLFGNHTEQVIKARNYKDSYHGAQEHPADCGGANGAVSDRTGPGGNASQSVTVSVNQSPEATKLGVVLLLFLIGLEIRLD